ncbi:hypothetical protein IQ266_00485 [filamentous cyanobacterium LEGE 11480]|uniref:Uncharacterized protein n=1 Tax=Romeriopsis navalis LEGE 11480 TaxID=2777977 RepID=A0A928VH52_9CYAN|nr:hypothetical protein [Romeriopsis navalis]MBE9028230.1 hypothetical protein [Romeriopsis navalis LEGE 11480]
MSHAITGVILKGRFSPEVVQSFDLRPIDLGFDLTLFAMTHYYTACWQAKLGLDAELPGEKPQDLIFLREMAIAHIMIAIAPDPAPMFAVIETDYFGGAGSQWALVYRGKQLADTHVTQISPALQILGIQCQEGLDEFDTVGLSQYRSLPLDHLDQYIDLADELGI